MAKPPRPEPTAAELLKSHAAALRGIPDMGVSVGEAGCFAGQSIVRAIELGAFQGGPRDIWLPRLRERPAQPKRPGSPDPHLSVFAEAEGLARAELGLPRTPPDVSIKVSFGIVADVLGDEAERLDNRESARAARTPTHLKIVPSEVISHAFRNVAHAFAAIRREWIKGDAEQFRLLGAGFESSSTGYSEIMIGKARSEVARIHAALKDGPDLIAQVLPHCDPSLRDEIQRMISLLNLHAVLPDRYGEETERWRQTWPTTGLDAAMDELLPKVRAAADRLVLDGDPILLSREWLDGYVFRLGEADRTRHLPGATRADYLKTLAWANDPQRDLLHKALDMVLARMKAHPAPPYSAEVLLVGYDGIMQIPVDMRLSQRFAERLHAWLDRAASFLSIGVLARAGPTAEVAGQQIAETGVLPSTPKAVAEQFVFKLDGTHWRVAFEGVSGTFDDLAGMRYIATLLERAGEARSMPAVELASRTTSASVTHSKQAVLDQEAKRAFEADLARLAREIQQAEDSSDEPRQRRLTEERDALLGELKAATGLAGHDRSLGPKNPGESARTAVSQALRRAYTRFRDATSSLERLAAHLEAAIKVESASYAYRPDVPAPKWQF